MNDKGYAPGDVIKLYGVYRCTCGSNRFYGVSGRCFPRAHCPTGAWEMVMRVREEKFF